MCSQGARAQAVAAGPLTEQQLVDYVASGCKPKEKWRIGTEHEKFGFYKDDKRRIKYEDIQSILLEMQERFEWDPIMEGENIIGLKKNGQSVTLEPGGQLELSGAPLSTVNETCAEVNSHLYQVQTTSERLGIGFLGLGFDPKWTREEIPIMPKGRYQIMRKYMPTVGSLGLDMMFRTCTVQVNLDFDSEEDMIKKFRVSLALQPIATALFANSPFMEGKPNGFLSYRSHVWTDTDDARTGTLPFVFDESFSFEKYVQYVLDVPMYFIYRNGTYLDATGHSFRDFLVGKCEVVPGEYATLDDWEQHLTTVFPEVRLKRYIEMRGADGGAWRQLCALPALWVGLLYDEQSINEAYELVSSWTDAEREQMRLDAAEFGLKAKFRDGTLQEIAMKTLALSSAGLKRRGHYEETFLKSLFDIAETGVTTAEILLDKYNGEWQQSLDKLYEEHAY